MSNITGIVIVLISIFILIISIKIYRLWNLLLRERIISILLWISLGPMCISVGSIGDSVVSVFSLSSLYISAGDSLILIGMIIFAVGVIRVRKAIYILLEINSPEL